MTTVDAVRRQLDAMGQSVYDVGLAATRDMLPRIWNSESIMKSIPWMRHENASGRHVYIRPHGEHNMTMVDDVSVAAIQAMKKDGFQPALVVETSPDNYQAWLKHDRKLGKELSTFVSKEVAKRYDGDPSSADWRHFGRLAGFTNRKEEHMGAEGLHPYVLLREASGAVYQKVDAFLHEMSEAWKKELARREAYRMPSPTQYSRGSAPQMKTIEQFHSNPRYGGDRHKSDLAYAVYALSQGVPQERIAATIAERDLSHKGPTILQEKYIKRTLDKARDRASLGR